MDKHERRSLETTRELSHARQPAEEHCVQCASIVLQSERQANGTHHNHKHVHLRRFCPLSASTPSERTACRSKKSTLQNQMTTGKAVSITSARCAAAEVVCVAGAASVIGLHRCVHVTRRARGLARSCCVGRADTSYSGMRWNNEQGQSEHRCIARQLLLCTLRDGDQQRTLVWSTDSTRHRQTIGSKSNH